MSKEMSTVTNKEPLMHISKRDGIETWKSWLIRIIAVLLSGGLCRRDRSSDRFESY